MSEEQSFLQQECRHARLDCVECAWIGGHSVAFWKAGGYVKLPQPAPEKPSADQGVTTESFDGFVWSRVLGKNVSNTLADLIRYRHRKDVDRATRELREDLTKAQGESEGWRDEAMRYQGVSEKLREENARIKAEVERLTKELDYLRGQSEMERTARGKWVTWQREMMGVVTSGPTAEEEGRAKIAGMMVSANREVERLKAANREQRRSGAEDAAYWLEHMRGNREDAEFLRGGIMIGEVLRDGEKPKTCPECNRTRPGDVGCCHACDAKRFAGKQERAPGKTGRLPGLYDMVFVLSHGTEKRWILREVTICDLGAQEFAVKGMERMRLSDEGVRWCWPSAGMG